MLRRLVIWLDRTVTAEDALRLTNRNMARSTSPWGPVRSSLHERRWRCSGTSGFVPPTDAVWSRSDSFSRAGARVGLWLAGAANLAMAAGFGWLASRRRHG